MLYWQVRSRHSGESEDSSMLTWNQCSFAYFLGGQNEDSLQRITGKMMHISSTSLTKVTVQLDYQGSV